MLPGTLRKPEQPRTEKQSSVLDPLESTDETNYDVPVPTFRHSGWERNRKRVLRAMRASFQRFGRMDAFRTCGAGFWVLRSKTDPARIRLAPDYCRDRFCVPCARARAFRIRANLTERLPNKRLSFLTLTLKHSESSLRIQLNRLITSYRRLRNRRLWTSRVRGAAAVVELKLNERTNQWHPHLHIIMDAKYIPHGQLSDLWRDITGDSFVIDIREAKQTDKAIEYLTKYVTKPTDTDVIWHPNELAEAVEALRGRKLLIQSGEWAHWRLTEEPSDHAWQLVCHSAALPHCEDFSDAERAIVAASVSDHSQSIHAYEFSLPPPT
jgi:hypothetical protein